uniref:MORC family CW-type zinc finger protein 4-like n=1 Tax=Fragaria vesca subsp. vesca TaxID=101020 RepID=UPI0005CA654E|nr:PREDICTED: MORC family CW-type zinc finger protein 4-like [Fragaria vesca subsp. vesca]XP_011468285.1 PREDICTED: MORC family CW-type zinc finger protein 4-like [Fragaria vesca subsp. vesca]
MSNSNFVDLSCDDDDDENGFSNSATPALISREFWKAGNYKVSQRQGHQAGTKNQQNHMRVHPMFLHSNATSHKWAFGGIAELLDNAVDEIQNGATYVSIDKSSTPWDGKPALLIKDDGGGMDPEAIRRCMSFGFTDKNSKLTIGQYGNGFKTSSMRLGADAMVFSRHRSLTQSVGLLSYTFLRRLGYDEILVPMVDYEFNISSGTYQPLMPHGFQQYISNLTMMLKWSPYSTEEELLKQFDDIGPHGTKIVIYNLWLNDDGDLELDFSSDPEDICINGENTSQKRKPIFDHHVANQFQFSLRVYASILYWRLPNYFKIILRGRDVEHYNVALDLKFPEIIEYRPHGNLKSVLTADIGFLKEAPHVNIHGFCIYHRNRLIMPFWRALKTTSVGRGVVGVLEANYIQPTHNKQDFEKTPLFQKLEDRLRQMTTEYWRLHCELIGYQNTIRNPGIELDDQESPSSRTRNCLHKPETLDRGSQNESSSGRLGKSADVHKVRNLEELMVKRKDLDRPVSLQQAKRHVGTCGTHIQHDTEQPDSAVVPQKIKLMEENKRLRSRLSEKEKMVEELNLKAQQLQMEQESIRLEFTEMLIEAKLLEGDSIDFF